MTRQPEGGADTVVAAGGIPGMDEGVVDIGPGPIRYVQAGAGSPLFLLHGGHGGWEHWHANIAALAGRYTVVAMDMPGFGASCDVPRNATIEQFGLWVWEAVTAIRHTLPELRRREPIRIAGFSFGTVVAATLGAQQPRDVASIILVNPPGLAGVSQEVLDLQARAAQALRSEGLRAGLAVTMSKLMLCQPGRLDTGVIDMIEQCVRRSRFVSRRLSRSTPLLSILAQLPMPAHVLLGEQDPHQRTDLWLRKANAEQALGPGTVTIFPGAAHWLQFDQPQRFNNFALDWFARPASTRASVAASAGAGTA